MTKLVKPRKAAIDSYLKVFTGGSENQYFKTNPVESTRYEFLCASSFDNFY